MERKGREDRRNTDGGLLTLGMIGAIWSTSSGVNAIIDTLNQAYDIQESRPFWKVKAALTLTIALALFIVVSFALVLVGPTLAEKVAAWFHLGPAFEWRWKIQQWPVVVSLFQIADFRFQIGTSHPTPCRFKWTSMQSDRQPSERQSQISNSQISNLKSAI
jgi:hypothetical protein